MLRRPPSATLTDTLLPSPPLFRSRLLQQLLGLVEVVGHQRLAAGGGLVVGSATVDGGAFAPAIRIADDRRHVVRLPRRSEEHTSELQSLMRTSYAVLCLKKKKIKRTLNI